MRESKKKKKRPVCLEQSLVAHGGEFAFYSKCNGSWTVSKKWLIRSGFPFSKKYMSLAPCGKQAPKGKSRRGVS